MNDTTNQFGLLFTYGGPDKSGRKCIKYRIIARTPDQLYQAMTTWHTYGNPHNEAIIPNDNFRHKVNTIFGLEPLAAHESNIHIKTTGCGAWGINHYPALAPTVEQHQALYQAKREADRQQRLAKAEQTKRQRLEEYSIPKRGWYYVSVELTAQDMFKFRTRYRSLSGYLLADSKIDAYHKFTKYDDLNLECTSHNLHFMSVSEWNSADTEITFLGMRTDHGYSIEAWEQYQQSHYTQSDNQ